MENGEKIRTWLVNGPMRKMFGIVWIFKIKICCMKGSKWREAWRDGEARPQALGNMAKSWRFQGVTYGVNFLTYIKYYLQEHMFYTVIQWVNSNKTSLIRLYIKNYQIKHKKYKEKPNIALENYAVGYGVSRT